MEKNRVKNRFPTTHTHTHTTNEKLSTQEIKGEKIVAKESKAQTPIAEPLNKINLSNNIAPISEKAFPASSNQSVLISELTIEDKKAFREIDQEGRKSLKILSLGQTFGAPNEVIGPIRIQTKPNKPIFLRAIDKGVFSNGVSEIFVRADGNGIAQIDFKLGKGMGPYRVLINTAGCGVEQVSFQCQPKDSPVISDTEIEEDASKATINETTNK